MGQGSARYNSITNKEKQLVLDSWLEIRPHMRDFSSSLFLFMINRYPYFANYWPYNSANDNSFDRFTKQFIKEFDFYVMHINAPDRINPVLKKHANYHVSKKIPSVDYDRLRKCVVTVLGDHMGEQATRKETLDAWIKVISICFSFINDMMEDLADENRNLAGNLSVESVG